MKIFALTAGIGFGRQNLASLVLQIIPSKDDPRPERGETIK